MKKTGIVRVVSGGQSGVDRAALDVAIALNLPHGGWCPQGRRAEDGPLPGRYQLQETKSSQYQERTRLNVRDSDGTLILHHGALTGGTLLTLQLVKQLGRLFWQVDLAAQPGVQPVATWLASTSIQVLNVAGPRQSTHPGIYDQAFAFLYALISLTPNNSSS